MTRRLSLCCALPVLTAWAATDPAALPTQGGTWRQIGTPTVLSQSDPESKDATAWLRLAGTGPCWRTVVEPGPYPGAAGLRWRADAQGKGGFSVVLAGTESGDLLLLGPDGKTLWQDQGVGWLAYSPVWIEGILDARGVRAQMLAADGQTVLAQSPWLPLAPAAIPPAADRLALLTAGNTARFCLAQRSEKPLAEYSEDNPSVLRVPRAGDDRWQVIGEGAWRWENRSFKALLQTRPVERTTAFMTAPAPAEGTWRCRLRLERGTCGGGMLIHGDKALQAGFLAWLGGTFGDGGLMVYRYPTTALWSSPQGVWKWDTEYVLEMTRRKRTVQARLLATDGTTMLAESPALPISAEEAEHVGMTGFQTWHGTGRFSAFAGDETPAPPAPAAAAVSAADLGGGWRATGGQWDWQDEAHQVLRRRDNAGVGTVVCAAIKGARGTFRCQATATGASAVALLFQLSPDGREGFECRLGPDGLTLRALAGAVLWEGNAVRCVSGTTVILEGVVTTDRVRLRVLDAAGKLLAESLERYVSDTNNNRVGGIGLRSEGGPAEFRDWRWTAE
jgi:hypothetical protein